RSPRRRCVRDQRRSRPGTSRSGPKVAPRLLGLPNGTPAGSNRRRSESPAEAYGSPSLRRGSLSRWRPLRIACLRCRLAKPTVEPLGVVVEHRLLELGVVEDALEDVRVLIHPVNDRVDEGAVEDEAEVVERVRARPRGEGLVSSPRFLELVEEELVGLAEVEAVALVDHLDDLRQVLLLVLVLLPAAGEHRDHLASSLVERPSALARLRDLQVRHLDLGAEVEPLRRLPGEVREQRATVEVVALELAVDVGNNLRDE